MDRIEALRLLVIALPNFNMVATSAFIDPFRAANYLDGRYYFRWRIASLTGGLTAASNGMTLVTEPLANVQREQHDLVVVSSSWSPEAHNTRQLHTALRRWGRNGSILGGIDTGAFILAEAGLLSGRRATVHYEHIDALRELYPDVVSSEDLFVFDDNRITCCGGMAAAEFALHIVRDMLGDGLANDTARYLFQGSLRPRGTPQNLDAVEPLGSTVPGMVKAAIHVMEENLEEAISIPEISRKIGISQRQLDRLFRKFVRKSPALYYRDIRLDRARGLVTQTSISLTEVAIAAGFSSPVHFSRAYRQRFGLPPRDDRVQGRIPFEFRAWPMHRKSP